MKFQPVRVLAACAAIALLFATTSGVSAQQNAGRGQGAAPAARPAAPASADANFEVLPVAGNVYLFAGTGANVAVQVTEEGAIFVDSSVAAAAPRLIAEVQKMTPRPIRYIINTSADADHVGGNKVLARAGVNLNPNAFNAGGENAAVLAHENVLLRMSAPTGQASPFDVDTWPDRKSTRLNSSHVSESRMPSSA